MIIYYTHDYSNHKGESRALLERAIAAHTGSEDEASRLVRLIGTSGEYGKPYIPGFATFSVSHSVNTWAVLIADDAGDEGKAGAGAACGLDIQYPRTVDAPAIAKRFFAPEDAELVGRMPDQFFRIWARREALIKAAGTSVAGTDVPAVQGDTAEYGGVVYRIRDIAVPGQEMYAAICTSGRDTAVRSREL